MIVYQVRLTTVDDYAARREPHRRAHIERLAALRETGVVGGGGPAPDGRSVDIVYRLAQPEQLKRVVEEDPYWTGGAWTGYDARSFREFVEPWEAPPIVLDGSRPATVVEGRVEDADMAQFVLLEMRGRRQVAFGGFFPDGATWALAPTADAEAALGWFRASGFWDADSLRARPLLWVL